MEILIIQACCNFEIKKSFIKTGVFNEAVFNQGKIEILSQGRGNLFSINNTIRAWAEWLRSSSTIPLIWDLSWLRADMSNGILKNHARGPWFARTCDPAAAGQTAASHMHRGHLIGALYRSCRGHLLFWPKKNKSIITDGWFIFHIYGNL